MKLRKEDQKQHSTVWWIIASDAFGTLQKFAIFSYNLEWKKEDLTGFIILYVKEKFDFIFAKSLQASNRTFVWVRLFVIIEYKKFALKHIARFPTKVSRTL